MIYLKSKIQNQKSKIDNSERGQSLFEIIFSLAIAGLIIVAIVSLASVSIRNSAISRNRALASRYAKELSEWLREERDKDFDVFKDNVSSDSSFTHCFDTSPPSWGNDGACSTSEFIDGKTIFLREASFACFQGLVSRDCTNLDVDTIEARVSVYWDDAQGGHEVKSVTFYSDWRK
jgi:Tfp pilus assembly protein PilV